MIPPSNTSHVVVSFPFDRITNLIEASRRAGILPTAIPVTGGWETLEFRLNRLDLGFRLRFRLQLGPIKIDGWQPASAKEVRLGADISLIDITLDAFELSTTRLIASINYALSGRAFISGTLDARPSDKGIFFTLHRVLATPDDTSFGLPAPWPDIDLQELMSRVLDRSIRARLLPTGLPQRYFPLSLMLETGALIGFPLVMNYALRDPTTELDWLSQSVCLPNNLGNPACAAGPGKSAMFFDRLDIYAARPGTASPAEPNLLGRGFQIDIGVDLLRAALDAKRDPSWNGERKFGPFRFTYDLSADIRPWPGSTDNSAGFWFGFVATEYFWYPKVKMCHGWTYDPFGGKWEYDYPCGVEDGWVEIQDVDIQVMIRLYSNGDRVCVERTQIAFNTNTNYWGALYKYIVETLIASIPYIGWIIDGALEAVDMIVLLAEVIAFIVARLVDSVLPNQVCASIGKTFAQIPLISDRVELLLSNALLEMKTTGITVAFDGNFRGS